MRTDLFIARRLRISTGKGSRSATGIVIAVVGVALAVTVMLVSIAIIQGFKKEISAKVTTFVSQLSISPVSEGAVPGDDEITRIGLVTLTPELKNVIEATLPGCEVTVSIERPGVLKTDRNFSGVNFLADPHSALGKMITDNIVDGTMPDFEADRNAIVLSGSVADQLEAKVGDKINAFFFVDGTMKARPLRVAAIFETHFSDYDSNVVLVGHKMLAPVFRYYYTGSGTAIKINGIGMDIDEASGRLQDALLNAYYSGVLSEPYIVDNAHRSAAVIFNWLAMLDTNVAVIIALMAAVAIFTLISSLFILILERVNTIGILKAIGASNALIRRVFIFVAERLLLRGMIIGNVIGLGLIYLEHRFHLIPLKPDAYYLTSVPVSIGWPEIVILNIGVIVIAALVLILPSHIVATISPAKSIRYD